jgi:hypothetical protein
VYEPSGARGDVDELVHEEALARARQAGHEDHSPIGQATKRRSEGKAGGKVRLRRVVAHEIPDLKLS